MFIEWIDKYSEPHFAVIRQVYKARFNSAANLGNDPWG